MSCSPSPSILLLLFICGGAAVSDLSRGRIPNAWIVLCLALAAVFRFFADGPRGVIPFITGAALPLLLFCPLFLFRMMGAGDIKLLAVIGSLTGPRAFLLLFLRAAAAGSALSLFVLFFRTGVRARFLYLARYAKAFLLTGEIRPYRTAGPHPENIAFSVPVLIAVLTCFVFPLKGVL